MVFMYCPTCGAKNPDEGRFCRSCGTDLEIVSRALHGELLDPQVVEVEKSYRKALHDGAIFLIFLILTILTILKIGVGQIGQEDFGPFILVLIWIIAALYSAMRIFARYKRKMRLALLEKDRALLARAKETSRLPEAELHQLTPPPSVTEQTTTRLSETTSIKEHRREHE
jgi:hypothetical protein